MHSLNNNYMKLNCDCIERKSSKMLRVSRLTHLHLCSYNHIGKAFWKVRSMNSLICLTLYFLFTFSLLVGAPRANSTHQRELVEPGAVFQCSVNTPGPCQQVKLDDQGKRLSCVWKAYYLVKSKIRSFYTWTAIIPLTRSIVTSSQNITL